MRPGAHKAIWEAFLLFYFIRLSLVTVTKMSSQSLLWNIMCLGSELMEVTQPSQVDCRWAYAEKISLLAAHLKYQKLHELQWEHEDFFTYFPPWIFNSRHLTWQKKDPRLDSSSLAPWGGPPLGTPAEIHTTAPGDQPCQPWSSACPKKGI